MTVCISQSLSGSFLSRVLPIQDSTCGWGGDRLRDFRERNSRTKIQLLLLLDLLLVSHLHLLSADVQSPAPDLAASQKWETIFHYCWGCSVVFRAGRYELICFLYEGLILAGLSHLPPQKAREASPPPLQAISQDTRDFIQVFNSQQSPSTAENGTSSQSWALKDLTHCYNRSATFHYIAISHSIISVQCNVWLS